MRLLIASDLHGSPQSVALLRDKAREFAPEACLLLGDILYHGPRNPLAPDYDTLETVALLREFPVPVMAVRGNCDAEVDLALLPFALPRESWLHVDGLRIFALHGHTLLRGPLAPTPPPGTVILSGHTHVPTAHSKDGLHWWNPGSLTLPKEGSVHSYATLENAVFRVHNRAGDVLLSHAPLG